MKTTPNILLIYIFSYTMLSQAQEIIIKPTTELLWYSDNYPVNAMKFMVKRVYNKETDEMLTTEVIYGYDNTKKWVSMDGKNNILQEGFTAQSSVSVDTDYIQLYTWDEKMGKTGIRTISSLLKEFPKFTFKALVKEKLSKAGNNTNQVITSLNIYTDTKKTQSILIAEEYDLDDFELTYVDANYDGYLDLSIYNKLYFYQAETNTFEIDKDLEDEYTPFLSELSHYNLFTKSLTVQHSKSSIEYRAINSRLRPYQSNSYYMNEDGEMITTLLKHENGEWKVIEETTERTEGKNESTVLAEDKSLSIVGLDFNDEKVNFSIVYRNKYTPSDQQGKIYLELVDQNGKLHRQLLFRVIVGQGESILLDNGELVFNGERSFLLFSDKLVPFLPLNLTEKEVSFGVTLELKDVELYSDSYKVTLPLRIKNNSNIEHVKGRISKNVKGDIYFKKEGGKVVGTFIYEKTGVSIDLKGTYRANASGKHVLNLQEFKKDNTLSGRFEGTIDTSDKTKPGMYKGYWSSPDRKTKVSFEFKYIE